jgi:very-short-patch-repair endonuclease
VPRLVQASEVPEPELRDRVRTGRLVRVLRGWYTAPAPAGPSWTVERHLLLARAAAVHRTLTGTHWFSGETAALLWGCELARVPQAVDVTSTLNPHVRAGRTPGVRRHWTSDRARAAETTTLLPIPASSLARAVVECTSTLPPREGLVVADSALRAGAERSDVDRVLAASKGARGVRRARDVLGWADGRSESVGESLLRYDLLSAGVAAPSLQVPVRTRNGWRWIDLGWEEECVGVEFDGRAKYGTALRDVHAAVTAERRRQEALEEQGWRILRVDWSDLAHPEDVAARVRRALRQAHRSSTGS